MKRPKYEIWEANLTGVNPPIDFALMSDLHHGLTANTHKLIENLFQNLLKVITPETTILLGGDLISYQQENLHKLFRLVRKHFPTHGIVFCYGNHDFWEGNPYRNIVPDYSVLMERRKKLAEEFSLHDVANGIYEKRIDRRPLVRSDGKMIRTGEGAVYDVAVVGFDGWYWHTDPKTNDRLQLRKAWDNIGDPMAFLTKKAHTDIERILMADYSKYEKVVCLTHFPSFTDNIRYHTFCASPGYMQFLTESFDVLCVGHSHRKANFVENGCLVLNCGSESGLDENERIRECPRAVLFQV